MSSEAPPRDRSEIERLVDERCRDWRTEPCGVPRRPDDGDLEFFRLRLGGGRLLQREQQLIGDAWATWRQTYGPGGEARTVVQDPFTRRYRSLMRRMFGEE